MKIWKITNPSAALEKKGEFLMNVLTFL